MFGPGVGEVLARGVPRAAGIDISQRVGEQDLLPFSRFFNDRRSFKDALPDAMSRSWGAPASMGMGILDGAQRIYSGDFVGGASKMVPNFLSAPVKAYRMTEKGFTDQDGREFPIASPGARDVMVQALGFQPAAKADYSEERGDYQQRKGVVTRRATMLRKRIVDAILEGDSDRARDLIAEARGFDAANPDHEVLSDIETSLRRRLRMQAVATLTRTPVGTSPKYLRGPQYANVEFQPQ